MSNKVVDVGLMETKAFKACAKVVGEERATEVLSKTKDELRSTIAECSVRMAELDDETEGNEKYQQACESKKYFDDAKKDAKKPYDTTRKLALKVVRLMEVVGK